MISSQHYIELIVQGEALEFISQESLNLRISNVIFDPTKTATKQGEFSYSFEIPSTPNNDRILGYANVLSKVNKFHNRYIVEVYADGTLIFNGSLTIRGYNAKDKVYECNIVNIKLYTVDDIFGESVLTDIDNWKVDYDGIPTINAVNEDMNTKYFFPLISYGAFQKDWYDKDSIGASYTPKHDIDKYNRWYHTSFQPSLNMLETLKKCFEWKGYTVGGNVFNDPILSNIFASCNLANEQVNKYNLGNPKFGHVSISTTWSTANATEYNTQDLSFPYSCIRPASNAQNNEGEPQYNFSSIRWFNLLQNSNGATVTSIDNSYLYNPINQTIVIPQDGWYKIKLQSFAMLNKTVPSFKAKQYTNTFIEGEELKERDVWIDKGLKNLTPIEIQLIRNYDDSIELIKGKWNIEYGTGNPRDKTYTYRGVTFTGGTATNASAWTTSYPHEDCCGVLPPTKTDNITAKAIEANFRPDRDSILVNPFYRGNDKGWRGWNDGQYEPNNGKLSQYVGYVYDDGNIMPYDPVVSEGFICGFSSLGNGTMSVIRDGSSWTKQCTIKNQVLANVNGLRLLSRDGTSSATSYGYNSYKDSSNFISSDDNSVEGTIECLVYLNRNDILELVGILRDYTLSDGSDTHPYDVSGTCQLEITAISERSEYSLKHDQNFGYNSPTEFDSKLNLFNFTNNEKKISEWVNNIAQAFNLTININGNYVEINTNQGIKKDNTYAVDIDDRVGHDEYESEAISYPREMSVKYRIDTDEYGFELTVPQEHINESDWKDWGDSGFTVISLSDDTYETKTQNTQTQFSYTYYDNFKWKEVLSDDTESGSEEMIRIPVIEKSEFMAEGYGYDEAMVHDGFSQAQRFWYRQKPSELYVWTKDVFHSKAMLTFVNNAYNGFNLSYKDNEKSIATEYFNIHPMLSSNYVEVECYLTPQEYSDIKNGALIHYDSDLYFISEISGYDPSGKNTTELKLIKKV